ncbi:hypothetical protein HYX06_02790 [Candidatus Woesearchaeota archaeon]|nr:hypothetical protein [Candidatus Woesearchaeota archaeon]
MVKIKKFVSLISVVFLILSNLALAQSDPSSYEGRPIDPSREGIDYYREGNVIVYPAEMGSEEQRMMERFSRGELSEEEMRKMAREKFGDKFDEMEFKRSMMESKERMERKDTFSYENEGYQGYYQSPSYEGYSKENMIFGMLFEHIGGDIDPRDIKQNCNEPDKIADTILAKLKEKVGNFQSICSRAREQESKCEEQSKKGCSQIGAAFVREGATEMEKLNAVAYSCPPNKDAVVEACKKRNMLQMEQRLSNLDEECRKRFDYEGERLAKECDRFKQNQICDKEKYMERCMGGVKKEEKSICPAYPTPQCESGSVLRSKTDSNGCAYHYCETEIKACTAEAKQCPDGSYVSRTGTNCEFAPCPETKCPEPTKPVCAESQALKSKTDSNGCVYYFCETAATACPEPVTPACATGTHLEKSADERGCVYYYCKQDECAQVSKPACASGERLESYYDNRGCVTGYQCIKYETACPDVTKPVCSEGQSLTAKYDDKGCTSYECVSVTSTTGNAITGAAVLSTYGDYLRHCENSWNEQQRICSNTPQACDKEDFVEKCKEQERKHSSDLNAQIEKNCQHATESEIRHAEERCSRIDDERARCLEHGTKRCEQMKGNAEKCVELMTEERVRKFIADEAAKRCKFKDILADEEDVKGSDKAEIILAVLSTATEGDIEKLNLFIDDLKEDLKLQDTTIYKGTINPNNFGDVKLLPFVVNAKISAAKSSERAKDVKESIVASSKVEEAASKLASLRDSDVPAEYLYIIEDKASEVLDASDELEDVENKEGQKGIGYKIKLFLGLAKAAEQEEIKQLEESNSKLQSSIDTLAKLIDEVPSDVAKAILKEQVENLKEQQADTKVLIESKEKKAKGWFGVFG